MRRRACVLVHGIHTSQEHARAWMTQLAQFLMASDPELLVLPYAYGYITGTAVAFPGIGGSVRAHLVKQFQKWLAERVASIGASTDVSAIGHSFGTYILHHSMTAEGAPRAIYNRMVYMGGIVSSREDFTKEFGHFRELLNLYSREDEVVRFAPFGHCGWKGFQDPPPDVKNVEMTPLEHEDYTKPGSTAWPRAKEWIEAQ